MRSTFASLRSSGAVLSIIALASAIGCSSDTAISGSGVAGTQNGGSTGDTAGSGGTPGETTAGGTAGAIAAAGAAGRITSPGNAGETSTAGTDAVSTAGTGGTAGVAGASAEAAGGMAGWGPVSNTGGTAGTGAVSNAGMGGTTGHAGDDAGGVGGDRCANVVYDNDVGYGTLYQPLEDYCADGYCPATVAEAFSDHQHRCSRYKRPRLQTACGYQQLLYGWYEGYIFEEASGELVGAYWRADTLLPCRVAEVAGGVTPEEACFDTGFGGVSAAGRAGAGGRARDQATQCHLRAGRIGRHLRSHRAPGAT